MVCTLLQLELHAHEQLDKAWRRLAKRDAKAAQADPAHVPAAKQPEAIFLPDMLEEFLQASLLHSCAQKRKDYAFRHQFNEKPSVIPGCPGLVVCTPYPDARP